MRHALTVLVVGLALVLFPVGITIGSQEQTPVGVEDPSGMELILDGVVVSSNPSSSVALVRRQGARRGRSVQVGESIYGMKLIAVSEDEAVFQRDGSRLRLLLGGGGQTSSPVWVARTPATSKDPSFSDGSREKTEGWVRRDLLRLATDRRLEKEMPVILAETGLLPRVEEGEIQGLQIIHLPDGTILSEVGLLPGDVLLSVNEVPLNGLSTLSGLYGRLWSEDEIRVIIERQGQILKLAYNLR